MKNVHRTRRLIAKGIALNAIVHLASAQVPDEISNGNAIAGQQLYFDHACYSCHGYTGETGARALLGSPFLQSEEVFRTYLRLRAEQNPTLPSTQMPNYPEESLNDDNVRDLFAYIKTFKSNAPDLEDIPVLNAIIGAVSRPDNP